MGSTEPKEHIYEWFGRNLHRVREPSLRNYVRGKELKSAGMDWTDVLAAEAENARERLAAELLARAAYASTAERVRAFVAQRGGCRATFFNYRRKLAGGSGNGTGLAVLLLGRKTGFTVRLRPQWRSVSDSCSEMTLQDFLCQAVQIADGT
jgi:hypothetical protein